MDVRMDAEKDDWTAGEWAVLSALMSAAAVVVSTAVKWVVEKVAWLDGIEAAMKALVKELRTAEWLES